MTMELFSTAKEQYKILSTSGRSTHKKKKSKQESQNMREHAICQIHIKTGTALFKTKVQVLYVCSHFQRDINLVKTDSSSIRALKIMGVYRKWPG